MTPGATPTPLVTARVPRSRIGLGAVLGILIVLAALGFLGWRWQEQRAASARPVALPAPIVAAPASPSMPPTSVPVPPSPAASPLPPAAEPGTPSPTHKRAVRPGKAEPPRSDGEVTPRLPGGVIEKVPF